MPRFSNSRPETEFAGHFSDTQPFSASERLYTSREIADRLGVSDRWVRDHATRRNPRLPAIKLGPLIRFRWSDVVRFLEEQSTGLSPFKKPPQRS